MSDSEGDISDELLELAGATERKRKKRQAKSSAPKRRKADPVGDSDTEDNQPESEEGEDVHPYPLEGKYVDEADRDRLMQMSEIEREEVLAQRLEEMQRIQDKRNLDQMLKAQSGHGGGDSVSSAAKRQHAVRGATKEKSRKLDELKARRKAKDEKKRTRGGSPRRDHSSSPVDMEMSEEEEEDGMITKEEEQEERERKLYDSLDRSKSDDETATIEDYEKCRLSRSQLAKHCMAPWFDDYVKGACVRYLVGSDSGGQPVYRVCEITNVFSEGIKPYNLEDKIANQELELKHGNSARRFPMDKVSNGPFTDREFDRYSRTLEQDKIKKPTRRQLEKKSAQLTKLSSQLMTESDISAMLARKNQLQAQMHANKRPATVALMERTRLTQERTLAYKRHDFAEVETIDARLAELGVKTPTREEANGQKAGDVLSRVNERNRKANLEAVRRAEQQESERKRRERKLLAAGAASRAATPTGTARASDSRPGTPSLLANRTGARSVTPLPPSALSTGTSDKSPAKKSTFEALVMQSVEIDLGDF